MNGFRIACLIATCLGAASPLRAEVYLWSDAQGRVHMADDLTQVPRSERAQARRDAERVVRSAQLQTFAAAAPAPRTRAARPAAVRGGAATQARRSEAASSFHSAPSASAGSYVLQVERAGSEMRVQVELENGVSAPFVIDSGAQTCTIPARVAEELGLVADEHTRFDILYGIGAQPVRAPAFTLAELRIGDLVVENLEVHVVEGMDEGLLGMPFLNQFRVQTDPAQGTLTLEALDESERAPAANQR